MLEACKRTQMREREEREREEGELRRGGSINRRKREEKEWGKE